MRWKGAQPKQRPRRGKGRVVGRRWWVGLLSAFVHYLAAESSQQSYYSKYHFLVFNIRKRR